VPLVPLGWALVTAASDRSRLGLYLLYAAALCTPGVVWAVAAGTGAVGLFPVLLYGLGLGFAANRLPFGAVRGVPAVRRRREV
jgi:hypothetical protein